tara:strand:- start:1510 stop:1626 length:117 start_codon:yes stop_codon:yes gene_type:complete
MGNKKPERNELLVHEAEHDANIVTMDGKVAPVETASVY